jgi:hypothetical protein
LANVILLSPIYRWANGEEFYTSKYNLQFWRASIVSFIFSNGSIKLALATKKKVKLGTHII